jgi:TolB-like protein/DNA-binding winged helix-turn-helix (wHTH) protein
MRFGCFELDEINGELRRDGALVKLPPRQFRLLHLLAKNSGQVVAREEIQREIWGTDTYVDFQRNLNVCIAQIRAALEDDSESPRFIQTVPRRGYRFVAQVEAPVTAPADPPSADVPSVLPSPTQPRARFRPARNAAAWIIAAACVVAAAYVAWRPAPALSMRLAVLPFENLNQSSGDDAFLDGLHSELISSLGAQDGRLSVIGRASVMRFKNASPDLKRAAQDLRADYVVEVTTRRADNKLRLTASLLRANDQVQVWTETFERDAGNSFELQEAVAAQVSAGVLRTLFPDAKPLERPARGVSAAAYQAYLDGRLLQRQGTRAGLERSESFFQTAVEQAPSWGAANAALAETYVAMARSGARPAAIFDQAKAVALAALRADPANAEAHNALANALFWHDWDWAAADHEFRAALAANPSFALAYHDEAFFLVATGRRESALTALRRAMALEPLSVRVNMDAGWLLLQAHRFDEAIAQAERARQLQPNLPEADACIARARLYRGEVAVPPDTSDPFIRATLQSLRGQREAAVASLSAAYSERRVMMVMLNSEPSFDKMRDDPGFRAIVAKMRFP